jgi:tetratricopeptide (TPR) repeat protein
MNNAINQAKSAINAAPYSVVPHETLASIYRDFSEYSSASAALAIAAFENAHKLEPTNPVILSELGKLYIKRGDSAKAEAVLREALNLKPDYTQAILSFASLISSEGKKRRSFKGAGKHFSRIRRYGSVIQSRDGLFQYEKLRQGGRKIPRSDRRLSS